MALSQIDLTIEAGELVSIIGPNGSGKSTLFNVIMGIFKPASGTVNFNGKEITGKKPHQVARNGIARTFQRTTILKEMTVVDNLIVAQRLHSRTGIMGAVFGTPTNRREDRETKEKSKELLHFVGLSDKASQPADLLTQEGKKKLCIAMALATNPKLLLLDEPAGEINEEEIDGLLALISKIRQSGVTICLIEHKMKMVMSISDRVLVMDRGVIIADGPPGKVRNDPVVVAAYLGPGTGAEAVADPDRMEARA